MADQSTETQLALLVQWRQSVEDHIKATDDAVKALQDERNRALRWGIITLGAAVIGMGSWIVNFVVSHIK